ncbi:MAG: ABC transporter ATP-binding protein [Cytophagales bacterium]|nr:ABC transporter ATP-binding protein [Cytophagales bacterium]
MLSLRNITKIYDQNARFGVFDINITIHRGSVTALAGMSGSGKSTIMKLLCGLIPPDSGVVVENGSFVLPYSTELLVAGYDHVRYVPQNFDLFPNHTVIANIEIHFQKAKKTWDERYVQKILKKLKLHLLKDATVKYLSGGEQQRVALACALCTKPYYLVLDEPFSHLDVQIRTALADYVRLLAIEENIGVLLAAHDAKDILMVADSIAVVQKGKIIAQNTPQKLYYYAANSYIAGLLGEYNKASALGILSPKYVRPEQLVENEQGIFQFEVLSSVFCGNYYRNICLYESHKIITYSAQKIMQGMARFQILSII